jgi:DNA adenine methylase
MSKNTHAKPFVKWAGGKSQILSDIRSKYPTGLGENITKYAEPFVGGGAVLFDVLVRYSFADVYISDANRELIHAYTAIRDNTDLLIAYLYKLENEYNPSNSYARKKMYYRCRDRFNSLKSERCNSIELAALFIFLNKTCFNGLYRVNSKGGFNVPQGKYANPTICDEENLRAVSTILQGVNIICADYSLSQTFIDEKTFAYFDPPYRPLTATASFTAYSDDGFGDKEQIELAKFIDKMSERGANIIASNSDPTNADEADDFMDRIYSRHNVVRITANRAINSKGSGRGRVRELLIATV